MLVISRQVNESIVIGDNIEITVCEIHKEEEVALGVSAPEHTPIHTSGIYGGAMQRDGHRIHRTCSRDESIMIGDDIEITIVDIRQGKVRLGLTAPKHIPCHRKEIYEWIKKERESKDSAPN